jgi:hypothetical protein
MGRREALAQTAKAIAGGGLGIIFLCWNLEWEANQMRELFCVAAGYALRLLLYVVLATWQAMQAHGYDDGGLLDCTLGTLRFFWPLLCVVARAH